MSETNAVKSVPAFSARHLTVCAAALALAFVTSYVQVFKLPFGGSVTLFSMLFICLTGYWYGVKTGVVTGLAYGILQFIQEPYFLNVLQLCCDYLFAFAALGLSGLFAKSKNGLVKGYLCGAFARGIFHVLGGYLFWMSYMPDNFPKQIAFAYPIIYNYSYIAAEAVITVAVISLPPVKKALASIRSFVV